MKVIPFAVFTLDRLGFKAPPAEIFENLFGYSGDQRFVGFSYTGHSLCIEDGHLSEIGHRQAWALWYRSLGVKVLKRYCFGYEGRDPEHVLVLDRVSRSLYAGSIEAASVALRQQIDCLQGTAAGPQSQEHEETDDEDPLEMLFDTRPVADIEADLAKRKEGIRKLGDWLEQ